MSSISVRSPNLTLETLPLRSAGKARSAFTISSLLPWWVYTNQGFSENRVPPFHPLVNHHFPYLIAIIRGIHHFQTNPSVWIIHFNSMFHYKPSILGNYISPCMENHQFKTNIHYTPPVLGYLPFLETPNGVPIICAPNRWQLGCPLSLSCQSHNDAGANLLDRLSFQRRNRCNLIYFLRIKCQVQRNTHHHPIIIQYWGLLMILINILGKGWYINLILSNCIHIDMHILAPVPRWFPVFPWRKYPFLQVKSPSWLEAFPVHR